MTDPNWAPVRHVAAPHGLRAVWSVPLLGRDARVLGTLAAYDTRPGPPTEEQLELLTLYARLTAMALERQEARDREEQFRREASARAAELAGERERSLSLLQAALDSTADGLLVVDGGGTITAFNRTFIQIRGLPEDVVRTRSDSQARPSLK